MGVGYQSAGSVGKAEASLEPIHGIWYNYAATSMDPSEPVGQIPQELSRRFIVRRRLGQGGSGVVYEAFDRSLGTEVALKELVSMEPRALYAFKQEFRALADVVHENLVGLHELFSAEGHFYLTMDLVRGVDFLSWVRPPLQGSAAPAQESLEDTEVATVKKVVRAALVTTQTVDFRRRMRTTVARLPEQRPGWLAATVHTPATPRSSPPALTLQRRAGSARALDAERLRAVLAELAEGVLAIHRTGRVHRDLKPSNVLVTERGRAVILDFGLVAPFESHPKDRVRVEGTPAYMSPEQAMGASGDAPTDWYSVGVMLYEALTDTVPHLFEGTTIEELLYAKHVMDPPNPRTVAQGVPDDLADLAMRLLSRAPATRACADDVFRVARKAPARPSMAPDTLSRRPRFVGRKRELAALRAAYEACVRDGRLCVVHVHGSSGMGKSDLVRQFFDDGAPGRLTAPSAPNPVDGLPIKDQPIVLEGRCHEREWVPYKAFDGAIDALARLLGDLGPKELAELIPPGFSSLARLFPVLGRLRAGRDGEQEVPDPHELRRRAFEALRELCARLSARRPLIFYVDDLQWADADSAALFEALLAPPLLSRVLFIASYRTEEVRSSVLVSGLPHPARPTAGVHSCEVVVGPLDQEDAEALARSMLSGVEDVQQKAARIARESGGNPFFVQELARWLASGHSSEGLDLFGVVSARVGALPEAARVALEIVSVAGRPIAPVIVMEAAELEDETTQHALTILRANGLLRTKSGQVEARVETYHDKIREIVVHGVSDAALAARHLALGQAMESMSNSDPEALAMHFRMAGEPTRARAYMERAALRAERALAFDRAATLYRLALDLASSPDAGTGAAEIGALELRLGDALAKAGRGAEGAAVLLSAAAKVDKEQALMARQRAVEHLLRAGHMDEGLAVVGDLLPSVGMHVPATPQRAFLNVVVARVKARFRGYEFVERPESEIDRAVLHRIDLCWSLGNGLGGVDAIRGADFQARHLALALEAGEPYRIARAFSWEAVLRSLGGDPKSLAEARDLAERAEAIAKRIEHPHALAWSCAGKALEAHNAQRYIDAAALSQKTIDLFREACSDIAWEVGSMYGWWLLSALYYIGDLRALLDLLPRCVSEADSLGDRYMQVVLGTFMVPIGKLLVDRAGDALECVQRALGRWSTRGYHTVHWAGYYSNVHTALYLDDGRRAYATVHSQLASLRASMLPRASKALRIRLADLHSRAALAAAREVQDPEPLLREALAVADQIAGERTPWSDACALGVRAAVLARRGDVDRAIAYYHRARSAFLTAEHFLFARATERRLGELEGGETGRARVEAVDAWMRERGVVRPDRMAAALSAG